MLFKKTKTNSDAGILQKFLEYCKTKVDKPLGLKMLIATDVCCALQIPLDKIELLKENIEFKYNNKGE